MNTKTPWGGIVSDQGCELLVRAIYEQAAKDYQQAVRAIDRVHRVDVRHRTQAMLNRVTSAEAMKAECRAFFTDNPYGLLSISGDQICKDLWLKAFQPGKVVKDEEDEDEEGSEAGEEA